MDKPIADQFLEAWSNLDRAVKAVETASTSNLSERIAAMMKARAEMDEQAMEAARMLSKVCG